MSAPSTGKLPTPHPQPTAVQLLVYALPAMPLAFIMLPLNIVIPVYYASNTAVSLAAIGLIAGAARFFDAFTDPLIGYLSDRTNSRLGARKPWLLMGTAIAAISVFHLFQPPPQAGIAYYAFWSFGVYLGYTFYEIPNRAWSAELSHEYNERARISTYLGILAVVGSLVFWVAPFVLRPFTGTTEISGEVLTGIAWLFVVLLPLAAIGAVIVVPRGNRISSEKSGLLEVARAVKTNKPFWIYISAITAWGIGNGAFLSVIMIYFTDYLQMGVHFPLMMIMFFVVQMIVMPLWMRAIKHFGKHRCLAVSWTADAMLRPLALLLVPGELNLVLAFSLVLIIASFSAGSYISPAAILGDIVDYDILKTGKNKAGSFFALNNLTIKISAGLGVAIALPLLGWFGYQVGGVPDQTAILGLNISYIALPSAAYLIAGSIMWRFPIDAGRHAIIMRRIESRGKRQTARSQANCEGVSEGVNKGVEVNAETNDAAGLLSKAPQ